MQFIQKNIYFITSGILVVAFMAGKVMASPEAPMTVEPTMSEVQSDKNPNSYSNPERPTFDAEGNQYDYQGTPVAPVQEAAPSCR